MNGALPMASVSLVYSQHFPFKYRSPLKLERVRKAEMMRALLVQNWPPKIAAGKNQGKVLTQTKLG